MTIVVLTSFLLTPVLGSFPEDPSRKTESTPEGIILVLEFPSPELKEITRDGEIFLQVSLPGCGYQQSLGKPILPMLKKLVEIPGETQPTLETEIIEEEEMKIPYPILPAQPPIAKSSKFPSQFIYDREFYTMSEWVPREVSIIDRIGVMRKHRVAVVKVSPVRYIPSEGRLAVIRRLKILVRFDNNRMAGYSKGLMRYLSPPFERLMRASIVTDFRTEKYLSGPIGYLAITPDGGVASLGPLVQWKRSKGFHATLVTLSEISPSPTAEDIKSYIQQAYDTWVIPPTYVLLVGDVDYIPHWQGDSSGYATDLYYSTVDGEDMFPDLLLGRLSVEALGQLNSAVEKVIDYEKNYWTSGDEWLKKAYFIASDDVVFHQVAESTHIYCMEIARDKGMMCDSLWGYYGTGTPVDSAFNEGRSIIVYSGHGSPSGWGGPRFYMSDVEQLDNIDMYPLVLSYACLTGIYSSNCFGETLIRGADYGALAFLGSSGPSYWDQDDIFQRYIFDALFSDSLHTLGEAIEYSKWGLLSVDDTLYPYYYEVYNLLGDPSLDIYTDSPHPIVVVHPDIIPPGSYILEVEVRDSSMQAVHALVSCTTDTIWIAYTDSLGIARIELETASGDTVWVTVTGHNLKPYQSHILANPQDVVESPGKTFHLALFQNHPNPFRVTTDIGYHTSEEGKLTLEIYDPMGRILFCRTERTKPGYHIFRWNGMDSSGKPVSNGMYFYRLKMDGNCFTRKMVLLR